MHGCREEVDRRGDSGVAAIAALASSGKAVLAVCADAIRRRALVERAARPARFGGGEVAIVSARLPEAHGAAAVQRVEVAGAGVVLADWAALARDPALAARFEHLVIVDPAPFVYLEELCGGGAGYLHRVDGPREAEFALRVHCDDWPSRASLAALYRTLRERGGPASTLAGDLARAVLCGEAAAIRSHPSRGPLGASSPSSVSCAGSRPTLLARSGSYPRRGRIWSDPRPSSPTATVTRRAGDT